MTHIVSRQNQSFARSAVPRSWEGSGHDAGLMGSARARAAQVLLAARGQAREILATARADGAADRRQGWEAGYQAGQTQAQQDHGGLIDALAALANGAAVDYQQSMRNLDKTVVALVLDVAGAVLRREASVSPDTILHVVRGALSELSAGASVAIRVNPADLAMLDEQRLDLGVAASVEIMLVGDPTVTRGGCLLESGAGRVDGTIEKQLGRIGSYFDDHLDAS
jgi:flagellar assembly protein FliH